MQASKDLTLNAKNTSVAEFNSLVSSRISQGASNVEDVTGEVVVSASAANNLSTTALSKATTYTDNLISSKDKVANTANSVINLANNRVSEVSQSLQQATLNTDLYDKALSLPETNAVSLLKDYSNDYSPYVQYGKFDGSTIYKDFSGTVDNSAKDVKNIIGWVNVNKQHEQYATVTNGESSYIVGINDIKPEPTVSDFQPLYDVLKNNNVCSMDQSIVDDVKLAQSQACTFKDISSSLINNNASDVEKYTSGATNEASAAVSSDGVVAKMSQDMTDKLNTWTNGGDTTQSSQISSSQSSSDAQDTINNNDIVNKSSVYGGKEYTILGLNQYTYVDILYPKQINCRHASVNDSVYNSVQAMVYDIADGSTDVESLERSTNSANTLLCYQQPESVSYSAACQFDQPAPRGAQQPFQFYVAANTMQLSFTLKWHIDELRTLYRDSDSSKSVTVQDIAEISESFTRPWERGNSIEPKLCKVILPGVQHIGYITEASIAYSGDMSGDYSTGSGVLAGDKVARKVTDYFYSQIEVTFQMIIIKDIKLKQKIADKTGDMLIADSFSYYRSSDVDASQSSNKNNEDDAKNSSGSISTDTSSSVESVSNSDAALPNGDTDKSIGVYKNEDGKVTTLLFDGKEYSSAGEPDGFLKSADGEEVFIANGKPEHIVGVDGDGDKCYLVGNTYVKAVYNYSTDIITDANNGVCIPVGA